MRQRLLLFALAAAALAALALEHAPGTGHGPARIAPSAAPRTAPAPSAAPELDPATVRDVFRFADEGRTLPTPPEHAAARSPVQEAVPATPGGPRLVGLVRRAGRLVAALATDGEIELAGPGERASGVIVLSVGEEGVRIRRADGSEETLILP